MHMKTEVEPRILANRIQTPDGTVLQSYYTHDYKEHVDANGHRYGIDGGLQYLKRTWSEGAPRAIDMSVYTDDPHEVIREAVCWGTRGVNGDQPLKYIPLMDMEDDHLSACLKTQPFMNPSIRVAMQHELKYRGVDE